MRRISAKYARPEMVLSRAVYDSRGNVLLDQGTRLAESSITTMSVYGVREILVEDWRVEDVPVQPLIAPEIAAEATQALRQLLTESQGSTAIDGALLEPVEQSVYSMTRELYPEVFGEVNVAGCSSPDELRYTRPVKIAELSMLMGRRTGYRMTELASLGLAALLMDVGYILLPRELADTPEPLSDGERLEMQKHPEYGAQLMGQHRQLGPEVTEAILQHHETWEGSGYPGGLKGRDICLSARILRLADAYFELVSTGPHKRALMPHEAVEFVMAYSGDLFDPEMVQLFSRHVPLYPTGVTVKLNTGELCIVSDSKTGHIGRPVVRICYDSSLRPLERPYDIDLSEARYQNRLIVQVLDY